MSQQIKLPSLNVDLDLGGYLEDLGAILEVLAIMVSTIRKLRLFTMKSPWKIAEI